MFTGYKVNKKGQDEIRILKGRLAGALHEVLPLIPEGKEKSIFKRKLEEAVFFAVRAIASKEENYIERTEYGKF